jgi:endonuclease YncB( thermonuclease family)
LQKWTRKKRRRERAHEIHDTPLGLSRRFLPRNRKIRGCADSAPFPDRTQARRILPLALPQERRIPAFGLAAMAGWRGAYLIAAFTAGFAAACGKVPALAEGQQLNQQSTGVCGGDEIARGTVRRVVDGRTFVLEDGREVRLAAIEVPPVAAPRDTAIAPPGGRSAAAALEALAGGDNVLLRQAEIGFDRYGRLLAYAYVLRDDDAFLLQRELVADGFARVASRGATACTGRKPPARPNLAYGPIRIMRCSTPRRQRMCWRSGADSRWSRAKWRPCAKAGL